MPYITQDKRDHLDPHLVSVLNALREMECDDDNNDTGANVNYIITQLLRNIFTLDSYREKARAISVLEMAKLEYYRVECAGYEDQKRYDNGDLLRLER
jgi:hypothetical protein